MSAVVLHSQNYIPTQKVVNAKNSSSVWVKIHVVSAVVSFILSAAGLAGTLVPTVSALLGPTLPFASTFMGMLYGVAMVLEAKDKIKELEELRGNDLISDEALDKKILNEKIKATAGVILATISAALLICTVIATYSTILPAAVVIGVKISSACLLIIVALGALSTVYKLRKNVLDMERNDKDLWQLAERSEQDRLEIEKDIQAILTKIDERTQLIENDDRKNDKKRIEKIGEDLKTLLAEMRDRFEKMRTSEDLEDLKSCMDELEQLQWAFDHYSTNKVAPQPRMLDQHTYQKIVSFLFGEESIYQALALENTSDEKTEINDEEKEKQKLIKRDKRLNNLIKICQYLKLTQKDSKEIEQNLENLKQMAIGLDQALNDLNKGTNVFADLQRLDAEMSKISQFLLNWAQSKNLLIQESELK